jgi:putative transposase
MLGHKSDILSGPCRDWLLERATTDFTLVGLVDELAQNGMKVDHVHIRRVIYGEELSLQKSILPAK